MDVVYVQRVVLLVPLICGWMKEVFYIRLWIAQNASCVESANVYVLFRMICNRSKIRGGGYVKVFAAKAQNARIQYQSSSGGVGHLLAAYALKQKMYIYGCVLDGKKIHHRRTEVAEELDGSKYVQSDLEDVFSDIQADLKNGNSVVFLGVACQVAALKKYIGENENLYTVDVLCHGVPSPGVFQKYIEWLEVSKKSAVYSVVFRSKDNGWKSCIDGNIVRHVNGKKSSLDLFYSLYFSHIILRPSCTKCPYTRIDKPSDITLCDFWNIEEYVPGYDSHNGVSRVLIHNPKGADLLSGITSELDMEEVTVSCCNCKQFVSPHSLSEKADNFYNIYEKSASLAFAYHQVNRFIKSIFRKLGIGGDI